MWPDRTVASTRNFKQFCRGRARRLVASRLPWTTRPRRYGSTLVDMQGDAPTRRASSESADADVTFVEVRPCLSGALALRMRRTHIPASAPARPVFRLRDVSPPRWEWFSDGVRCLERGASALLTSEAWARYTEGHLPTSAGKRAVQLSARRGYVAQAGILCDRKATRSGRTSRP